MLLRESPSCQLTSITSICVHYEYRLLLESIARKFANAAESNPSPVRRETRFHIEESGCDGLRVRAVRVHHKDRGCKVWIVRQERRVSECDLRSGWRPASCFMNPRTKSDLLQIRPVGVDRGDLLITIGIHKIEKELQPRCDATGHQGVTEINTCKYLKTWWPGTELNRRRQPFQGCVLPFELSGYCSDHSRFQTLGASECVTLIRGGRQLASPTG